MEVILQVLLMLVIVIAWLGLGWLSAMEIGSIRGSDRAGGLFGILLLSGLIVSFIAVPGYVVRFTHEILMPNVETGFGLLTVFLAQTIGFFSGRFLFSRIKRSP